MTALTTEAALDAKRDDPRYQRLMEATREAARDGYDAVSMRRLAETCRVSMTTIYQFCSSKDQLIAEAHAETMQRFRDHFSAHPAEGQSAAQRVGGVLRAMARALEVDETLSRTVMRALYSTDPHVGPSTHASVGNSFRAVIDGAIGDADVPDRDAVIATLGHVLDSVIFGWLARRHDVAWVRAELATAVGALLGPADDGGGEA